MRKREHEDHLVQERTVGGPLFAEAGPFDASTAAPSSMEQVVGDWIWRHQGRANPIAIAELEKITGLSARALKGIVEQLRVAHHMPIGANRDEPAGYFWIVDAADQVAAVGPYKAQIISMWRTLRVLDSKTSLRELLGQLRLED